jgi:sec-independent protein translocase protein TatA
MDSVTRTRTLFLLFQSVSLGNKPMLGTPELLVILLIIIVIFGASKLPQLGDALGRSIKNFKSAVNDEKKSHAGDEIEKETKSNKNGEG